MSGDCISSPVEGFTATGDGQLRWWHLIRWIVDLIIPCCWTCEPPGFMEQEVSSIVTGTIICPPNNKVRLCLQKNRTSLPLLLLDLPLYTWEFAYEIRRGMSRIAFECHPPASSSDGPLLHVPSWATYCNGRKIGFATRRQLTDTDTWLLDKVRSVSVGAGILSEKTSDFGKFKYLRGNFERVMGSSNSESFHLIDPSGTFGQELSIFFLRL